MNTVAELYGRRPPKAFKYKGEEACVNPDLIVGLELETENCRLSEDTYITLGSDLGIDVKGDNSLRVVNGNGAFEFITRPTMIKNVLATLRDFYKKTEFNEDNYSDRCSVHVHVNCCDMTFEQVSAVALIYTVVEEVLFKFVNERPGNKEGWSRDTNIYCVPWNQCRDHLNLVYNFTNNPTRALGHWQKYTALNLLPLTRLGTMEWRHMHGTADMDKISKWLNIIGAIYKHAKATPLQELVNDINSLNTVSHYGKFFDTVLGGQLPYNDGYRKAMEEGCILAKYSVINWSLEKNKPGSVKPISAWGGHVDFAEIRGMDADEFEPEPARRDEARERGLVEALLRDAPNTEPRIATGLRHGTVWWNHAAPIGGGGFAQAHVAQRQEQPIRAEEINEALRRMQERQEQLRQEAIRARDAARPVPVRPARPAR